MVRHDLEHGRGRPDVGLHDSKGKAGVNRVERGELVRVGPQQGRELANLGGSGARRLAGPGRLCRGGSSNDRVDLGSGAVGSVGQTSTVRGVLDFVAGCRGHRAAVQLYVEGAV